MKINLSDRVTFESRHNSATPDEIKSMLAACQVDSLDELIGKTVPEQIRLQKPLDLPKALNELEFLQAFKKMMSKNETYTSYIGRGYYPCVVPSVIQRNILENPGWYTAYTPYQAEIAQGRLEALINFQTMVTDLTGMELANASLLDEGTAAAEAMTMLHALRKGPKKSANTFFVSDKVYAQTLDLLKTRSEPMGIDLVVGDISMVDLTDENIYGIMVQYPDATGEITDYSALFETAHDQGIFVSVAADLLSLTLLTPPGEMGADVVVGTTQRMGIPMGYGGPHAAYFATKEEFKRQIPGRIIGVSVDKDGNHGYRMALQTREQHIRREKATSNICTAQVLLAVMSGMYAVYHGAEGLKKIAMRVHGMAQLLRKGLDEAGYKVINQYNFDTITLEVNDKSVLDKIKQLAIAAKINLRYDNDTTVGVSMDETTTPAAVDTLITIFYKAAGKSIDQEVMDGWKADIELVVPESLQRKSTYMEHPVFNMFHSEHELLRYMKRLENKDLSLVHSMISLGSCTMKLNATTEMIPVTWPEMDLHPFAPQEQVKGYKLMIEELQKWLEEITGFDAVSMQPNSGAQGEYAGLMVIRGYHMANGDTHRNIALIPSSAHGTNPASAVMAGMKVVIVKCDEKGNIDLEDLQAKSEQHSENLAALMVTYPSTHGVFEEAIQDICAIIHKHGGQVYMDGANMNAQVGLTSPAIIGADVCHLNLHKTFCIPHGGGGPGMGPIGVKAHLKPFLPGNVFVKTGGEKAISAISAAPFGSASILAISYAYIAMMGGEGLTQATKLAILNANYIRSQIKDHYKILYTGKHGFSAHEMIIDCRDFKKVNVEVEDIAKRLMDYGFHAPTVSFPVPGTMMIEPTESESRSELDRFCNALIQIREEIREIENGMVDQQNNVLKNAPHTQRTIMADNWSLPYTREKAAYPLPYLYLNKFWPTVSRIDSAYGDRNLMCSCVPVDEYAEDEKALV